MPFRAVDLHDFDVAREVRIETSRGDGETRSTVIWVVVDEGQLYIRSVRGARGHWYRDALENPNITIADQDRRLGVRAVPVHDADSIRRFNDALKRKYDGTDGYAEMLEPDALDATLRLEPQFADEMPLEAPAYLGADEPSELGPPVEVGMLDGGPAINENIVLQPHKPV